MTPIKVSLRALGFTRWRLFFMPLIQCVSIGAVAMSSVYAQVAAPRIAAEKRVGVEVEVLAQGLAYPWSMAFLPDNKGALITEKPGRLRLWHPENGLSSPITGVPEVYSQSQGGLLDVALAPDFLQSRRVYLAFAETDHHHKNKAGTAIGYGRLSEDGQHLEKFKVIVRQTPKMSSGHHFGARMAFDHKGYLFIALGENNERLAAQDVGVLQGKVLRLHADGSIPSDNPFVNRDGMRPEIWSYGHRNPQGAAINPWTNALWVHEHGPRGGDELNIPKSGKNYGWPIATYGMDYPGSRIPESQGTHASNTEQPLYYWGISPAISGMAFYDHVRFTPWRNSVFIGALKQGVLIRLHIEGNRIKSEEWMLKHRGERIRDVRVGPDGFVYVLTDEANAKLLRVGLQP